MRGLVRNLEVFLAVLFIVGACQAGPTPQTVTTPTAKLTPTVATSPTPQTVESPSPALTAGSTTAIAVGKFGACVSEHQRCREIAAKDAEAIEVSRA